MVGLDGDPSVLEIAHQKAARAGVALTLDEGMAYQLPYPGESFDRVVSSLVLHHLTAENKQRTMREIHRILRSGGELHIVDFGKPRSIYARLLSQVIRLLEEAEDNIQGLLPEMLRSAGFQQVVETFQYDTILGGLSHYKAKK